MAKGSKGRRRIASRRYRATPYSLPSCNPSISENLYPKKCSKALDKKDWEDATCSVCMECPHNAVLLLCSSHDKGCRPYMCGTSFRYSNCLDQYKNAYTKVVSSNQGQSSHGSVDNPIEITDSGLPAEKCEVMELACPLCRGQVKGWTVVEPAREYLNAKQRSCMQEDCSFVGTYKELRKHMKADHPSARPREVDPNLEQKWRRLERERERDDVISTIRSTMPGAMVFGDYVIEGNHYGFETDGEDGRFDADSAEGNGGFEVGFDSNLVNVFLLLHAFGASGTDLSRRVRQSERTLHRSSNENDAGIRHTTPIGGLDFSDHDDENDGNDDHSGISLVSRLRRHGRVLLNRSGRRRRRREINEVRDR
ncbi:Protein of unknown function (DUF1644) [Melia azedarach]|uniref:Uncharacterized protein n=2 Tax=Melia azedarach TaxID=155640 RepID=A0ACC1Y226_MELAZ|nr:Protein of unknown function (DUF1644) [Melia azedarach]KAJ4716999.1 Protein of unknown function (DUF1644) [Melia azedarach]